MHVYKDSYSGMGCGAMVELEDGTGDQCGLSVDDPVHGNERLMDKVMVDITIYGEFELNGENQRLWKDLVSRIVAIAREEKYKDLNIQFHLGR